MLETLSILLLNVYWCMIVNSIDKTKSEMRFMCTLFIIQSSRKKYRIDFMVCNHDRKFITTTEFVRINVNRNILWQYTENKRKCAFLGCFQTFRIKRIKAYEFIRCAGVTVYSLFIHFGPRDKVSLYALCDLRLRVSAWVCIVPNEWGGKNV